MFEIFTKTSSKEKRGRNLMQKLKKKLLKREKLMLHYKPLRITGKLSKKPLTQVS